MFMQIKIYFYNKEVIIMSFINIEQTRFKLLGWPILIFTGVLLTFQHSEAREWKFNLPLDEVSASFTDEQTQGSLIHVNKGDDIIIHIINNTPFKHTIRWHGIQRADKLRNHIPEMTKRFLSIQKTIETGENFTYHWKAERVGTFWHHCHVTTSNKQVEMSARQAKSYQGG
jgi:FtsP/CotA-like multicopper oxidase with cupredoxin domain